MSFSEKSIATAERARSLGFEMLTHRIGYQIRYKGADCEVPFCRKMNVIFSKIDSANGYLTLMEMLINKDSVKG